MTGEEQPDTKLSEMQEGMPLPKRMTLRYERDQRNPNLWHVRSEVATNKRRLTIWIFDASFWAVLLAGCGLAIARNGGRTRNRRSVATSSSALLRAPRSSSDALDGPWERTEGRTVPDSPIQLFLLVTRGHEVDVGRLSARDESSRESCVPRCRYGKTSGQEIWQVTVTDVVSLA
jgi:hypothetical protein